MILITGASGKNGREIIRILSQQGAGLLAREPWRLELPLPARFGSRDARFRFH
jgi:uncharacterized protein YbjT (DUF2867 family)